MLDTNERKRQTSKVMAQYPAYIPAPDSLFAAWSANFSTLLTASPTTYGLLAGDAVAVAAAQATWLAAYNTAVNPPTRTSGTIAAKDAARAALEAMVRPLAVRIILNPAVTNLARTNIGVTVPSVVPSPIPAPVTNPTLILVSAAPLVTNLQFRDASAPLVKAKPFGVVSLDLFGQYGVVAGTDPDAATYVGGFNKTPFQISHENAQRGKHCTLWARWKTRSGPAGVPQVGPWSDSLDVIVV